MLTKILTSKIMYCIPPFKNIMIAFAPKVFFLSFCLVFIPFSVGPTRFSATKTSLYARLVVWFAFFHR